MKNKNILRLIIILITLLSTQKVEAVTKKVECPVPKKIYKDYTYFDVGQKKSIPSKYYIPNDLVRIDKEQSLYAACLKKETNEQLSLMINDAKKDKMSIKVSSGFRSYDTQKALLAKKIKSGDKNATKSIAKAGYSEHQLGVAVDLTSESIAYQGAAKTFAETDEYLWLKTNAYKYGFIESYPEGKEKITGYVYEAWHYRYVGIDHAFNINKNSQTVNEYLADLNKIKKIPK